MEQEYTGSLVVLSFLINIALDGILYVHIVSTKYWINIHNGYINLLGERIDLICETLDRIEKQNKKR